MSRAGFVPVRDGQNAAELGPEHDCNADPFECWAWCPVEVPTDG